MTRLVVLIGAVLVALTALVVPSAAQGGGVLEIPLDTIVREPEGSVTLLASPAVPPEAVGLTCTGEATTSNQGSVHPNNDLIVETGGQSVVFEDVEDIPGRTITASGSFVLGDTFTVSLLMGPDEVFSGGIVIAVECEPPATTTTTEATTTTAAPTTSEAEPVETTTTTEAPQTGTDTDELPATGPGIVVPGLAIGAALLAAGLVFLGLERRQPV
ncbi:MAG: hypothetical protein AAGA99_13445 [Actinomycetota bacterium]